MCPLLDPYWTHGIPRNNFINGHATGGASEPLGVRTAGNSFGRQLGCESIAPRIYKSLLPRDGSENSMRKSFVLELHGESSELAMSALP